MQTVRTTIRIRKDLLDQSRMLALQRGTNLQEVINDILIRGFTKITDLNRHKQAMDRIDAIRKKLPRIDTEILLEESKKELENRAKKILGE